MKPVAEIAHITAQTHFDVCYHTLRDALFTSVQPVPDVLLCYMQPSELITVSVRTRVVETLSVLRYCRKMPALVRNVVYPILEMH